MQYIVLTLLWVLWCIIHSLLITSSVTKYLEIKSVNYFRFYRLFYNFVAVITLLPILFFSHQIKSKLLFSWEGYLIIIQLIFFIIAFILFLTGARKYDIMQFLGIRQIKSGQLHVPLSESGKIDMTGILGITRHPWYLGAIIVVWVINKNIYFSTLIINIILTGYLIIGAWLEEKRLISCCGDKYKVYQKQVSMLIPVKWVRGKLNL